MKGGLQTESTAPNILQQQLHEQQHIINRLAQENTQLTTENQQHKARIICLQEQLNLALARRYAARSEKRSPDQLRLFNEAEAAVAETAHAEAQDRIRVPEHTRKKRGRKPLPDALPRMDVIHELAASEWVCSHDGAVLNEIGELCSEQLDIIPAKIQVIRHMRKRYACDCEHTR